MYSNTAIILHLGQLTTSYLYALYVHVSVCVFTTCSKHLRNLSYIFNVMLDHQDDKSLFWSVGGKVPLNQAGSPLLSL